MTNEEAIHNIKAIGVKVWVERSGTGCELILLSIGHGEIAVSADTLRSILQLQESGKLEERPYKL